IKLQIYLPTRHYSDHILSENKLKTIIGKKKGVGSLTKDSVNSQIEENKQKELKNNKRYSLYDQMNINEKYLDYFIVGVILLLFVDRKSTRLNSSHVSL